jgi:hypothetical protein
VGIGISPYGRHALASSLGNPRALDIGENSGRLSLSAVLATVFVGCLMGFVVQRSIDGFATMPGHGQGAIPRFSLQNSGETPFRAGPLV